MHYTLNRSDKTQFIVIPSGMSAEVEVQPDRRALLPRRVAIKYPVALGAVYGSHMIGKRTALFDRRIINGVRRSVQADQRADRRFNPGYYYKDSLDPRIRALERRGQQHNDWMKIERRVGKERRVNTLFDPYGFVRRMSQRRKS